MDEEPLGRYGAVLIGALVVLCMLVSCGCIGRDKIGEITSNPSSYEGKTVKIKGTVIDTFSVPLVTQGAYQVSDGTGSIWVVTTRGVPAEGEKIAVTGTARPAFKIAGRSFGMVIMESTRG
ncbi:MAG: hypothetical protein EFT35_09730 [Methanophagales archaeon ANME-1-THS]|nr:MAG: hypothetical protein EFT35_09730 [Methanophagales archaeon ANME-1-THS]